MTWAMLGGAVVAGLSVATLCGPAPQRVLTRRLGSAGVGSVGSHPWRAHLEMRAVLPIGLGLATVVVLGLSAFLLGVVVAVVTGGVRWLHLTGRRRREHGRRQRQVVESCEALAAEMRAGQPALRALMRAAEQHQILAPAARACALGGDIPSALRRSPGQMATVAATWQVAEESGSGLADALERVAESLRADEAALQEVAASLSPARATSRLLAVLPVFGLLLGAGLGGDPVGLLLATTAGHGLLLAGVCLALAGTVWVERLARRVES